VPLADRLRKSKAKRPKEVSRREPLWKGPCSTDDNGGITFSLLSRWLVCRHRFYIYAIQGIQPMREFNHRIEYGSMWHVCEEHFARGDELAGRSEGLLSGAM